MLMKNISAKISFSLPGFIKLIKKYMLLYKTIMPGNTMCKIFKEFVTHLTFILLGQNVFNI